MANVLAGRAATFSKGPEFWSGDPKWEPRAIDYGRGAHVWGTDGREYIDYVSGLGAISLGYPDQNVDYRLPANRWAEKVSAQAWDGAGFSLPHPLEAGVAERLTTLLSAHVPGWQNQPLGLRWGKTGSDACSAAVRLARAVTGRMRLVLVGYHGQGAEFIAATPPAWGVPEQPAEAVPFGDVHELWYAVHDEPCSFVHPAEPTAAVIIEQPPQPIPDNYWQEVRRLCDEHGALLILDEVVSGLRYGLGGAAERFGIRPDLVAMGKGLGNGLPISCIVGRREYFEWFSRNDPVFISSTHFGEAVGLAAADAVLNCWDQAAVDHLWHIGVQLMAGLKLAGYRVTGYPPVFLVEQESPSHRAFVIWEMARRGILANRPWIPNLAHSDEDVLQTIEAAREIKAELDRLGPEGVEREMAGKLPQVLFSNR